MEGTPLIINSKRGMTKKFLTDDKVTVLRLLIVVIMGFLILLDLTMIFSASTNPLIIALIFIYMFLPPFLAYIRHAHTYFIILPVPYLGSWLMSIIYLSSFNIPVLQASVLVSIIPMTLVTSVHLFSRSRYMIGRVAMGSFSRTSLAAVSAIFLLVGLMILGSTPIELDTYNQAIFYSVLLFAYIASSMLYVNSAYRYRVMCKKLGTNRMERKMSSIWKRIGNRFSDQEENVDLLRYFFEDALRLFEEGNYEMAFICGHKVINEETVVNPKDYISDKRKGKPSFSEIRTILLHSRRKKTQISIKRIRETKRKLPQDCIELLQRCLAFLKKLTTIEMNIR